MKVSFFYIINIDTMEFIERFESTNNQYTRKIKDSQFFQGHIQVSKVDGMKDICSLIISNMDSQYVSPQEHSKIPSYKIELSSNYNSKLYLRNFTQSLVEQGLQEENSFSSILFLNDHYKINCIIHNVETDKYYKTGLKNYHSLICDYQSDKWTLSENPLPEDVQYSNLSDIKVLKMDIDTNNIYKTKLLSIQKYKLSDLEDLAKENNICILNAQQKKKKKKELYDDINLKYTQDI